VRESERFSLYAEVVEKLKAQGRLYACYETADELERKRKRQIARSLPPVYDRAGQKLTPDDHAAFAREGRAPHWRFTLEPRVVHWNDGVRGECHVDCASLSDPVLVREDGTYLYTLPSVTDDIDIGITNVIRGEDHVTNTAVQLQLFEALGATPPQFAHHNLLTTASGEGLSKRLGHLSLQSLRDSGIEPQAVAALAVLVGTAHPVRPVEDLMELAQKVQLSDISRAPAKFDESELGHLNSRLLHELSFAAVEGRLAALGIVGAHAEPFWLAVRTNLHYFREVTQWWPLVSDAVTPVVEDAEFLGIALKHLPPQPWDATTWSAWTKALQAETGRKGKGLFLPLRQALTGRSDGPELAALLPLWSVETVTARLQGKRA
jgi:glutamyl-tRNA synthetase